MNDAMIEVSHTVDKNAVIGWEVTRENEQGVAVTRSYLEIKLKRQLELFGNCGIKELASRLDFCIDKKTGLYDTGLGLRIDTNVLDEYKLTLTRGVQGIVSRLLQRSDLYKNWQTEAPKDRSKMFDSLDSLIDCFEYLGTYQEEFEGVSVAQVVGILKEIREGSREIGNRKLMDIITGRKKRLLSLVNTLPESPSGFREAVIGMVEHRESGIRR